MSYANNTTYYRNGFLESVQKGNAENAKKYAFLYVRTLREMSAKTSSYMNRATLLQEIQRYDGFIALISKEGVSAQVKDLVLHGKTQNEKAKDKPSEKQKPTAPAPRSKTPPAPIAPITPAASIAAAPIAPMPIAQNPTPDEWIADVFEKCLPATLMIETSTSCGTGFFISNDGLLLTNHHVVHEENGVPSKNIHILSGDENFRCKATLIAADADLDVALIRADIGSKKTPFIPLIDDYEKLRPGMDVVVIGNAFSFGLAPVSGTVKFTHDRADNDLIYTAPTNNGDSGGPVLNRKGECVGINKSVTVSVSNGSTTVHAQGLTNATAADDIKELIQTWKKRYKL